MARLEGFRKIDGPVYVPAEAVPARQQFQRPARKLADRDQCPVGWDTDLWHLTLLFDQAAQVDGIELRTGRALIYREIEHLVDQWHLRTKTFVQYADGCERRHLPDDQAAKCWFHTRADVRQREITWVEMVEVIMAEFWSRIWNEHALDSFRQQFADYGRKAVQHWRSLSVVEAIDARPKTEPVVMRRRTSGATMPGGSKEGA